jgi:hypothetical protein
MSSFIFEHRYRHQLWRVQIAEVHGVPTVSDWPWFTGKDGELRPGAARFGGGFQMPLDRLTELRDAITKALLPDE